MNSDALVKVSREGSVGIVTIDRQEKLNALDREMIGALKQALARAAEDDQARVLVLTGAGGKAFVAGADIAQMSAMGPTEAHRYALDGQAIAEAIDATERPVIAAIEGFALGGGCELALMCHLRVASPKSRFGQPEVGLGLIPGFGGTQRLARLVGEGRALEMILSGSMIGAEQALQWGLINRIAQDRSALEEARQWAQEIAGKGPVALRLALEATRGGLSMPLADGLEFEAALFGLVFSSQDMKEGTTAFLEKRAPQFRGK